MHMQVARATFSPAAVPFWAHSALQLVDSLLFWIAAVSMWSDDDLVAILSCSPQADRLGSCSLVNKQFRQAAARASTSITVSAAALSSTSFKSWIKQHGQHVSGLHVLGPLDFDDGSNQACSTSPKVPLPCKFWQLLPTLKTLQLPGSAIGLHGVGAVAEYRAGRLEVSAPLTVLPTFWQQLSGFSSLQELCVPVHRDHPSSLYEPLPSSVLQALLQLKQLRRLSLGATSFTASVDTTPQLGQLTNLDHLSLIVRSLQPQLLAGLTQLVDLRLTGRLDNGDASDNTALFEVLSGMSHLTSLHLEVDGGSKDEESATQVRAAQSDWYSAVTSSSKLQHLHLDMPLPQSAWKEMFHADLQLPEQKILYVNGYPGCYEATFFDLNHMPGVMDLTALQSLSLKNFVLDANALLLLPQLRKLHFKSVHLGVPGTGSVFEVVPQLQHLTCFHVDYVSNP